MNTLTKNLQILLFTFMAFSLGGCDLIGDVLEFSFWVVLIVIALLVGLIAWIVRKLRG